MKGRGFLRKLKTVSMGAAMADIALLLLVFFMASTTTEPPKGIEVTMPKAKTEGAEQDSIYITVSKQGNYYYDGAVVSLEQLSDRLAMRSYDRNRIVSITADKGLPYRVISALMETLKKNDFLNIVYMAEQVED